MLELEIETVRWDGCVAIVYDVNLAKQWRTYRFTLPH